MTDSKIFIDDEAMLRNIKRLRKDFLFFCRSCVKIKVKDGSIVNLNPNKSQIKLYKEVLSKIDDEGVVLRVIILKARQMGFSTFLQAFIFWRTMTRRGQSSVTVAQDEETASELFRKVEMMYQHCPPEAKVPIASKKAGEYLAFADPMFGQMNIETLNNTSMGRGTTRQIAHLTEVAFAKTDPRKTVSGLTQSVARMPGTLVVLESTANGMNYFYEKWKEATDPDKDSGWIAVFYPWHWESEYQRPHRPQTDKPLSRDEKKYQKRHELTLEQMLWRRDVISTIDGGEKTFRQEYPASAEEAFLSSGNRVFEDDIIMHYEDIVDETKPVLVGDFDVDTSDGRPVCNFVSMDRGPLHVFEQPVPGETYVIGSDHSQGTGRDSSGFHVLKLTGPGEVDVVATYKSSVVKSTSMACILIRMSNWYNQCKLSPERNQIGTAVIEKIVEYGYQNRLYIHRRDDKQNRSYSQDYGILITPSNRASYVEAMANALREKNVHMPCRRTLQEMKEFVYVEQKNRDDKAQADQGGHDDMLMSLVSGIVASHKLYGKSEGVRVYG